MIVSARPKLAFVDPFTREIELVHSATYYPLGFPLLVRTNSHDVLAAAQEAWGRQEALFDRPPVQIRVAVQPEGEMVESLPAYGGQWREIAIVADRHNFAVLDGAALRAYCYVSQKTAAARLRFRMHFLEAMTYSLLCQHYGVPMHGACVAREGRGVLLCGTSGAGKSTLAMAAARTGWAFVCDDATWLIDGSEERLAVGNPHQARFRPDAAQHFPELAGYVARQRPNGKISLEVPLADFPEIRTRAQCSIEALVVLDRGAGERAGCVPIPARQVVEGLLDEMPNYGEEVTARYERTLERLVCLPAWRMQYTTLAEGLELLNGVLRPQQAMVLEN